MKNVVTAIRDPKLAIEYLGWRLQALVGPPTFLLSNRAKIGNFTNFGEYHSMRKCISLVEQKFLLELVAETTGEIIDVGANIGLVSILIGYQYPGRKVRAIEPAPSTVQSLRGNVELNQLKNVVTYQIALTDRPGTIAFSANPKERATARIATAGANHIEEVLATTLDLFVEVEEVTTLSLLKIDVEGFESSVLQGAQKVLSQRLPQAIFMEVCPPLTISAGYDPVSPLKSVAEAGYNWFRLMEGGGLQAVVPEQAHNVELENWVAFRS